MTKKKKQMPSTSISLDIKIGETENTYEVELPNNGQLIDIERNKFAYSGGVNLAAGNTKSGMYAYLFNDMVANFSVMIPNLQKDFNVGSLFDLNPLKTKQVMKVYIDKFLPWWREWEDIFSDLDDEEVEEIKEGPEHPMYW